MRPKVVYIYEPPTNTRYRHDLEEALNADGVASDTQWDILEAISQIGSEEFSVGPVYSLLARAYSEIEAHAYQLQMEAEHDARMEEIERRLTKERRRKLLRGAPGRHAPVRPDQHQQPQE